MFALVLCLMAPCLVEAQDKPDCGGRIRFAVISCLYSYIYTKMFLDVRLIFPG